MTRWEPNARGRLEEAALELFVERGYDRTTVEDIATRAGVTKRTFFRHFADKREVLFAGAEHFEALFVDGLAAAPADAPPLAAVAASLQPVGAYFADRRAYAQRRQVAIASSAELQERTLVKMASVASALAAALRERGVPEPAASVAAETGVAVFRTAFDRWMAAGEERSMAALIDEGLETLRAVTAAPAPVRTV